MLMLISQDRLKAIDTDKIDFYYIVPNKNQHDKYMLQAKSPKSPAENGYYDFLNLFEHEDIEVVKEVLRFLVYLKNSLNGQSLIVDVDIPNLKRFGFNRMKEESKSDFEQSQHSTK